MLIETMVKELFQFAKRYPGINHQENTMLKNAALTLQQLLEENQKQKERIYELEERIAIMTEADEVVDADPEWPPIDEDEDPGPEPDEAVPDELG